MPRVVGRPLCVVAVLFAALLTAYAPRYGYHRDELYFLAAARHADWGYPDQPPLTPLLARAMSAIDADSLLLLRLPSVAAATFVVVAAGLMARELGGGRGAQLLASLAVASAAMVMGIGHLLSTASFDIAAWVLVCLLVLALLRGAEGGAERLAWGAEADGCAGGGSPAPSDACDGGRGRADSGGRSAADERDGARRVGPGEQERAIDRVGPVGPVDMGAQGAPDEREVANGRVAADGREGVGGRGGPVGPVGTGARGAPDGREVANGRVAADDREGVGGRVGPDERSSVGRPGQVRLWLGVGLVVGIGLQNKALLIFPVVALVLALVILGPRKIFATRYFPMAVGVAMVIWLPYLVWQWRNGWPQWEMSRAIAGGSSGTSDSPMMFVLSQFGLMGPLLVPLWVLGLWRLWRDRSRRAFPVAYAALFVVFLVSGGKAYYLGGMYPILVAAGAVPVAAWLGSRPIRWAAVGSMIAVNAIVSAVLFLPVLPVALLKDSPVLAINYDAGETIGWPQFVRRIAEVRATLGPDIAILTDNYGEAGAIEHFGGEYGLPTPHSGHNSYWWWGPPSDTATAVIVVGLDRDRLIRYFAEVEPAGHIDNGLGIANDEQGKPLFICREPRVPLSGIWPAAKHLS
ncbi:glycosyltransferase family 39 protein [Nocardia sp. CA-084685]|uniref:glycosyltransferase family 39 protein n=1 Tax=Nocardia sp. CA-084685 TaxID=3239970 RepID=UPI003D9863E8